MNDDRILNRRDCHRFVADSGLEYCRHCGQSEGAPLHSMSVTPQDEDRAMTAMQFAQEARAIGAVLHDLGLRIPAFRSPPRDPDVTRSVQRYDGGAVVAVRLRGQTYRGAKLDMVLGAIVANGLAPDSPKALELAARLEIS